MSIVVEVSRKVAESVSLDEAAKAIQILKDSRSLGRLQMEKAQGKEIDFEVNELLVKNGMFGWRGGIEGRISILGIKEKDALKLGIKKENSLNSLDHVQLLVAKRNLIKDELKKDMVSRETKGVIAELRKKIQNHEIDIQGMTEQMRGALEVVDGNDDYKVVGILKEAINEGDRRDRKMWSKDIVSSLKEAPYYKELISGVVFVLWTEIDGERKIYTQVEKTSKAWCDKERWDRSIVAGEVEEGELLSQALDRELREEAGISRSDLIFNPRPIGCFQLPPDESANEVEGPWFIAFSGRFMAKDEEKTIEWMNGLQNGEATIDIKDIGPTDEETMSPRWVSPSAFVDEMQVRGGMIGVVKNWMEGRVEVVEKASSARR